MIMQLGNHIDPRSVPMILLSIIALTLVAAYLYLFKTPSKLYLEQSKVLDEIQQESLNYISSSETLKSTQQELNTLNKVLSLNESSLPENQMMAHVIGKLDEIATHHQVQLNSVGPGSSSRILMFSEIPYHIEIDGAYQDLFRWLYAVEMELGSMVIKRFNIKPINTTRKRRMELTVVSYQLLE